MRIEIHENIALERPSDEQAAIVTNHFEGLATVALRSYAIRRAWIGNVRAGRYERDGTSLRMTLTYLGECSYQN